MSARRALLILTAHEAAIFSARAATEGHHQTLPHPTGAALLGWAAGGGRYMEFEDPYTVFHSGLVRFSNALPLTGSGCVAYPVPQILTEPKTGVGGSGKDAAEMRRLNPAVVTVGFDPDERDAYDRKVQREALKRLFVTADGEVLTPRTGSRLRTATEKGRAAEGQLFGYTHLDPGNSQRYAATIEAESGAIAKDKDWRLLLSAFRGVRLRLGRAAGNSYGGDYSCEVDESEAAPSPWPRGVVTDGTTQVRVWALSDLALIDSFGSACFSPSATMLGLPDGGTLSRADSAIGVRRYAPWNGHLRGRDLERQVIEAGSVFTFTYKQPLTRFEQTKPAVGLCQEAGLGRIAVAPALLGASDKAGAAPVFAAKSDPIVRPTEGPVSLDKRRDGSAPVMMWLAAMKELDQLRGTAA